MGAGLILLGVMLIVCFLVFLIDLATASRPERPTETQDPDRPS